MIRVNPFFGFLVVVIALGPWRVVAQTTDPTQSSAQNTPEVVEFNSQSLKVIEIPWSERWLRSWQYQFQVLEQPAFLVASSGGTAQTIPNPNYWLFQNSIVLSLSELFPRTQNLSQLVQAAYDNHQFDSSKPRPRVSLGADLCPGRNALWCLAAGGSGKRGFFERLATTTSLTFSNVERPTVQQNVILNLSVSQAWGWNGQIDFNPTNLFVASANWKNAVSVLGKGPDSIKRTFVVDETSPEYKCFVSPRVEPGWDLTRCEHAFAGPRLRAATQQVAWTKIAAAVIPTFQFKALSQFDFIKQGGILAENPLLQRSLKNFIFTWDMKRLTASATDRITIANLYEVAKKSNSDLVQGAKAADSSAPSMVCILQSGTTRSYVTVGAGSTVTSCERLAIDLAADYYAVGCAWDKSASFGTLAKLHETFLDSFKPSSNCGW